MPTAVIESIDADTIYDVPLLMREEKLDVEVLEKTNTPVPEKIELHSWEEFVQKVKHPEKEVSIGLIGKYVELKDAYKSINESFIHGGSANNCRVNIIDIHSESVTKANTSELLGQLDGILVAPGFGGRGIAGKIDAIQFARENKIPFLGICLGMQCAAIEFTRNVLGMKDAHTTEINADTPFPVIDIMEEQKKIKNLGGTMRLGA